MLVVLLPFMGMVSGQSKKTIREKGITSRTVYEYFVENGNEDPLVESIEKFDEEGELTEVKEMNRRGEVRKWEKYVYNEDGKLVEEIKLDVKGKVSQTLKYIYADGLRIEKQYYNEKGWLVKRKAYVYEYSK